MQYVNSFQDVFKESTCQKRVTICEIYDKENNLLSRESNKCNPNNGICSRLNISNTKENYPKKSSCNWIHAEELAIKNLPEGSEPHTSILYGHDFYCDSCEKKLKEVGVKIFEIEQIKERV